MFNAVFDQVSNRQDWIDQIEVLEEDDTLVDLSAAVIVLSVRDKRSKQNLLTAQTADGTILIQGLGIFQFTFTLSQMRGLDASKQYEVGCTIQLNGVTQQFFVGNVPIIDGVVA